MSWCHGVVVVERQGSWSQKCTVVFMIEKVMVMVSLLHDHHIYDCCHCHLHKVMKGYWSQRSMKGFSHKEHCSMMAEVRKWWEVSVAEALLSWLGE